MAFFARDAFICTCKKEECDLCNKKYFEPNTNADRIHVSKKVNGYIRDAVRASKKNSKAWKGKVE